MLAELVAQSWRNLRRQRTRSLLTMLGIVWGIVAVAVLMSYGRGFRAMLIRGFDAFGKSAVVCWPGQTSAPFRVIVRDQGARRRAPGRAGPAPSRPSAA